MAADLWDRLQRAVQTVRARTPLQPRLAVVLGSGLGALAGELAEATSIPYQQVPGFPQPTAPGHAGRLVLGYLEGQPVAALAGRGHLYEGYSAEQVVFPVRVARLLGAETLIITNAAGGVNAEFRPGDLMLIADQINLTGQNPLVGPNEPRLGPRFPDMTWAYSPALRRLAREAATRVGLALREGVYLALTGPSFETPAEIRMAQALGADAIGMSTALEVIAAKHCGLRVLGISCITNLAAGILPQPLSEEEVLETTARLQGRFIALLRAIIAAYSPLGVEGEP